MPAELAVFIVEAENVKLSLIRSAGTGDNYVVADNDGAGQTAPL